MLPISNQKTTSFSESPFGSPTLQRQNSRESDGFSPFRVRTLSSPGKRLRDQMEADAASKVGVFSPLKLNMQHRSEEERTEFYKLRRVRVLSPSSRCKTNTSHCSSSRCEEREEEEKHPSPRQNSIQFSSRGSHSTNRDSSYFSPSSFLLRNTEPSPCLAQMVLPCPSAFQPLAQENVKLPPPVFIQALKLLDKKDPAVVLSGSLFYSEWSQEEKENIREAILLFANTLIGKATEKDFYSFMRTFSGKLRSHFQRPLQELIEIHKPFALKLLLSYLEQQAPKEAAEWIDKLEDQPKFESYPPFPYLTESATGESILDAIIETIPEQRFAETIKSILPRAYEEGIIDSVDLSSLIKKIRPKILLPGSKMICSCEKEGYLRAWIEAVEKIHKEDGGVVIENILRSLRSICMIDMDHILKVQYGNNKISGLHVYPENGRCEVDTGRTSISAMCMYPQFFTDTTRTAPVVAEVVIDNNRLTCAKMSTFPRESLNPEQYIRQMEEVLMSPLNDPAQGTGTDRYFGRLGNNMLLAVMVNDQRGIRRIISSYPIPFWEIRDLDEDKQFLPFHEMQVQHERNSSCESVDHQISPQKALAKYVLNKVHRPSNQNLEPFIQEIQDCLKHNDAPFHIIPTRLDGPVLVEIKLSACGISLDRLMKIGYRDENLPSGQTKRVPEGLFSEVFRDVDIVLQYSDWETFSRILMNHKDDKS